MCIPMTFSFFRLDRSTLVKPICHLSWKLTGHFPIPFLACSAHHLFYLWHFWYVKFLWILLHYNFRVTECRVFHLNHPFEGWIFKLFRNDFSDVKGYATDANSYLFKLKPTSFEQFILCFIKLYCYIISNAKWIKILGRKWPIMPWHHFRHIKRAIYSLYSCFTLLQDYIRLSLRLCLQWDGIK